MKDILGPPEGDNSNEDDDHLPDTGSTSSGSESSLNEHRESNNNGQREEVEKGKESNDVEKSTAPDLSEGKEQSETHSRTPKKLSLPRKNGPLINRELPMVL